jgi:subtilisin family serine protease
VRRSVLAGVVALLAVASPPAHAERILVSVGKGDTASFLHRTGLKPAGPVVPEIGLVTVAAPDATAAGVDAFVRRVRGLAGVRSVQPDGQMRLRLMPNDPAVNATESRAGSGTPMEWWLQREGFFAAWDVTRGAGAKVAVIDSGVDANHPDIAGKVAAAIDQDAVEGDGPATTDHEGHGTHVASLACGATNNGFGIAGAGFDCSLIVEKSDLSDASVAASIVDAANRGAQAINMSFGDDGSRAPVQAIADAIDYAVAHGAVPVAAAADQPTEEQGQPANMLQPSGTGPDPAKGKGLVVTAADASERRASFAGKGSQVSLAAYGSFGQRGPPGLVGDYPSNVTEEETGSVLPPEPPCLCRTSVAGDNRFAYLEGTSMSAPQVAAVAAMLRALNPDLGVGDVVALLKQTARRQGGWSPDLGWGILDADAAIHAASAADRRPPDSQAAAPRRTRRRSVAVRVHASDAAAPGLPTSGVASVDLYASRDGRAPHRIATLPGAGAKRVKLRPASTYAFSTVATDRAGNREAAPARPDAVTRALRPPRPRR